MHCLSRICFLVLMMKVVGSGRTLKKHLTRPWVPESETTMLNVRSKLDCATHVNTGDLGFAFKQLDKSCYLFHCVNPNITNSTTVKEVTSTDIFLIYPLAANYLLARGKTASMSSEYSNDNAAGKAVDGVYVPPESDQYSAMAHSDESDNNPWWRVDLEQIYCVWGVNILNRVLIGEPSEPLRNKDVEVTVSRDETQLSYDTNPDSRCNYFDGPLNHNYTLITCIQPMRGQFVQIQYRPSNDSVINLYEIEVFGV